MNLVFTWDDLKAIIKTRQKQILVCSLLCSIVVFLYYITNPLSYEAKATFKQSSQRGEQSIDLKSLIRTFSSNGLESSSASLMLSDSVLEKTIREMGLQAQIVQKKFWSQLFRNLLAEFGRKPKDRKYAQFSSVTYTRDKPLVLFLKKDSKSQFSIYDKKHRFVMTGKIGKPIKHSRFEMTLNRLPFSEEVPLILHPIQTIIETLRAKLTIKASREDKNLLIVKYVDQHRKQSAAVINALMAMYEKFLIEENQMITRAQLSYLNQRQDELSSKFDRDIQDHAVAIERNLESQGLLGIKEEMEFVLEPLQTHKTRLNEVELELSQIEERIAKANLSFKLANSHPLLIERYSKALTDQIGSIKNLMQQVKRKEKIVQAAPEELQPAIEEFNRALETAEADGNIKIEAILHEFMSHLTYREKSLQESSEWIQTAQNDLSGISLEVARRQFDNYSTQFDDLHAQLKQVVFMRDHLFDPHFEISTLSNVLADSVTQQMVQRSSELEEKLHDDIHRSLRDKERIKTTLTIHKRFLESHLNQTLQLGKIRIDLIKEKLSSLYTVMKTLLIQEQEALKGKIAELTKSMQSLPGLWVHENRLKFKSELTKGMMEGLVHISETKNLAHHLYQVESRPLDLARPPMGFIKPYLFAKSLLAFFLGMILFAFLVIIHTLIKGFPLSLTTLKEMGAHTSGRLSLSTHLEKTQELDKETLRKIVAFLLDDQETQKGIISIIGQQQTHFSPLLSALLKKYNKISCILDCTFGKITSTQDSPGLFQVLHGESLSEVIRSFPAYDFVPVGASTQDGVELLKSAQFHKIVQDLSSKYDFLFLISRTPLDALESQTLFQLCTHGIVAAEANLELVKPYLDQSRQKAKKHVTFIQIVE